MPWRETAPVDERSRFIDAHRAGGFTMTELCARFGISRRIGYKWLARYDAEGRAGLHNRSRAPHRCPHRIDDATAALLCAARRKHRDWGPEKLLDWLRPVTPEWTGRRSVPSGPPQAGGAGEAAPAPLPRHAPRGGAASDPRA